MQNELNLQIKSNSDAVDASLDKLISTLEKVDRTMNSVLSNISSKDPTSRLDKSIDSLSKKASTLKNTFNFAGAFELSKRAFTGFSDLLEKSIDYSENLNLFNVALDDLTDKGMKFQNTLNEAFGTNQSETLRFQGLFQAMSKSMGIANDDAYKLSEGLTKIGFDLASLYNISDVSAMNKLRAGLAGQTEPLRTVGMDITENSLKPIIEKLDMRDSEGELLSPRQLSYAEKMLLRYLAIVDQAKVAQGDFANTIEAPANQLKILGMQAQEAGRAIGNLFVGAFAKILPYANAVVMVIKEVAKAIAGVLGIEISDYNSSIGSVEDAWVDVEDSTSNIGDNLDDADKKAKKLQRTTMGFDEIHNISTPTSNKSDSDSGTIGGAINPKLLAALDTYDNGMEKVRMKATQIRDAIMEWLGFTKKINPLTGETYFEYQGIDKTLKNMWESFKGLSTTGKIIVGLGLVAGATKLLKVGKNIVSLLGNTGLGKAIKSTASSAKGLFSNILTGLTSSHSSLKSGIQSWREQQGIIDGTTGKVNGFKGALNMAKTALMGIGTSAVGLGTLSISMQSVATDGWNLANTLGTVGGALTSIAGGAMAGAAFGPWGAAIGGAVGAVGSLITAIMSYGKAHSEATKEMEKSTESLDEYVQSMKESRDAINEEVNGELAHITYSQQLVQELDSIVDANGKVKEGYEDRAQFILGSLKDAYGIEYQLIDGVIQNYDEYKNNVSEAIELKKSEILLNANEEAYAKALQDRPKLYQKMIEVEKDYQKTYKEREDLINKLDKAWDNMTESQRESYDNNIGKWREQCVQLQEYDKELKKTSQSLQDARNTYADVTSDITQYENLQTGVITENKELQQQAIDDYTNKIKTASGERNMTLAEEIEYQQMNAEVMLQNIKNSGEEISEEKRNQAYAQLNILANNLAEQTATVEELTPELTDAWKSLAEQNYEVYAEKIRQMPPEMQTQIQNVTGVVVSGTDGVVDVTKDMADKMLKQMKRGGEAKDNALATLNGYLDGLSDNDLRNLLKQSGVDNVNKVMEGIRSGDVSEEIGKDILRGIDKGINDKKEQGKTKKSAESFSDWLMGVFKGIKGFFTHSPSHKTEKIGENVGLGIGVGITNSRNKVEKNVSDFSDNVLSKFKAPFEDIQSEMKFDDYKVDFVKDVNYGAITREINFKTNVEMDNNLISSIAGAVAQGVGSQNINVQLDVNAKTDEATIVNTAIKGINKETTRTGECPIRVF